MAAQHQLDAILTEVRVHRDFLADRAMQLASDLADARARIADLEAEKATLKREVAGPSMASAQA